MYVVVMSHHVSLGFMRHPAYFRAIKHHAKTLCHPLLGIVRGFSKQCCYFKVFVIIINNNINRYDQYLMKVNVYFTYCDMSKHTINTENR